MEKEQLIHQLAGELSATDLRAEVLIGRLMAMGLAADECIVSCDGDFPREYNRDILSVEQMEEQAIDGYLQFHLSRAGLYDRLPEGIFFKASPGADRITNYRCNRQKEAEARLFFRPFENGFFRQRVSVAMDELQLTEGLLSGRLEEYLMEFWGMSERLPLDLLIPLVRSLPYLSRAAGDTEVIPRYLQYMLGEPVKLSRLSAPATTVKEYTGLGRQRLGLDMVMGGSFAEDYPVFEFTIGPLEHSTIPDYLEGGIRERFLEVFYSLFLPVEAGVTTRIAVRSGNMILAAGAEPVLGISSILNPNT